MVENIIEIIYSPKDGNQPKYSEDVQIKYLQQTLNSTNAFILSLVMSCVGSQLKLLRMSWYRIMKQFQTNMKLVIRRYLYIWHKYFPGVDSSPNDLLLSEISTYFSSYNYNSIILNSYICLFLSILF